MTDQFQSPHAAAPPVGMTTDSVLLDETFSLGLSAGRSLQKFAKHFWGSEVERLHNTFWKTELETLNRKVREELAPDQQHWLLPRDQAYYEKLLADGEGAVFGAFLGPYLSGAVTLMPCASLREACESQRTICEIDSKLLALSGGERIGVVQALSVHPDARGKRLARHLLRAVRVEASAQNIKHLFAQVSQDNVCSWLAFMGKGFSLVKAVHQGGHDKFILYKHITDDPAPFAAQSDSFSSPKKGFDAAALLSLAEQVLASGRSASLAPYQKGVERYDFVFG